MKKPRYAKEYKYKSSLKLFNFVIMTLVVFFSILLSLNTITISNYNNESLELSRAHINYTDIAMQLNLGSDILTEQVRLFAETGNPVYLEGYFEESGVTRHRDIAMAELRDLPQVPAEENVKNAMRESMKLMEREYYAMRLTAYGYGISENELPDVVRETALSPEDLSLSAEEAKQKARHMLFDEVYADAKDRIKTGVNDFLDNMVEVSEYEYSKITKKLERNLWWQSIIIAITMIIILSTTLFLNRNIVAPLVNASKDIKNDLPIEMPPFLEEMDALGQSYNNLRQHNTELVNQLKGMAHRDALTGVGSRFAYNDYLDSIDDKKKEVLLFLFDLNNLRNTNNKEGHAKGDMLLANAGKCIKKVFGIYDYENCFRVGGDEFVAFIEGEPRKRAHVYLDAFREETKNSGVSVSVGYSYAENISNTSVNKMFKEADVNMYKEKYGEN